MMILIDQFISISLAFNHMLGLSYLITKINLSEAWNQGIMTFDLKAQTKKFIFSLAHFIQKIYTTIFVWPS
jgi:hypothetical protein